MAGNNLDVSRIQAYKRSMLQQSVLFCVVCVFATAAYMRTQPDGVWPLVGLTGLFLVTLFCLTMAGTAIVAESKQRSYR